MSSAATNDATSSAQDAPAISPPDHHASGSVANPSTQSDGLGIDVPREHGANLGASISVTAEKDASTTTATTPHGTGGTSPENRATLDNHQHAEVSNPRQEVLHTWVKPRAKTKGEREAVKGKKRGNPGRFRGEQLNMLQESSPTYQSLPKGRQGKNAHLAQFWDDFLPKFWERFTPEDVRYSVPDGDSMDEEGIKHNTDEAIKRWFRRASQNASGQTNIWAAALKSLRKPTTGPPRKQAPWQLYMSHSSARILELYEVEKGLPANANRKSIELRSEIARRLFGLESREEQERWVLRVEEEHVKALEVHEADCEGLPSSDPESQEEARANLGAVVTPLLELISKYTGLTHLSLLAGAVKPDPDGNDAELLVRSVHHGKTCEVVGRTFNNWDKRGFERNCLDQFTKFLNATQAGKSGSTVVPQRVDYCDSSLSHEASDDSREESGDASHSTGGGTSTSHANQPRRPALPKETHRPGVELRPDANEAVKRRVQKLEGRARDKELRRLANLTEFEMTRENTISRNRELMEALSITSGTPASEAVQPRSEVPAPNAAPLPQRSASLSNSSTSSPAPASNTDHSTTASGGLGDSSTPSPEQSGDSSTRESSANVSAGTGAISGDVDSTTPTADLPANMPKWLSTEYERLSKVPCNEEHQTTWKLLLLNWAQFEAASRFQDSRPGLPATHRPASLGLWIQKARNGPLEITNSGLYETQWNTWWTFLNPSWRTQVDGKLTIGGEGDWSKMFYFDKNGFLTVLKSLEGLRTVANIADFEKALIDVAWVMQQLLTAKRGSTEKRASPDEPSDEDAPQPKRRR